MKDNLDPKLVEKLAPLQAVPERDPERAGRGREAFLQLASDLAQGVTRQEERRHIGWMHALPTILKIHPKERSPMFSTLSTLLLIVSLAMGGGGITVAAAQASQPDQPLYGIKVWSEDVRLGMTTGTRAEWKLALEYTNRRAQEIRTMIQEGHQPPAAIQARYQNQVEEAIRLAANLTGEQALQALEQVRTRLQAQLQSFLIEGETLAPPLDEAREQTRLMLQERLQWTDEGLEDPVRLRERLRQMNQTHHDGTQAPSAGQTARTQASGAGAAPGTAAGGSNPWATGTPTPGSGYGPGPGTGDCHDCTPASPGPAGPGHAGNPWTEGTPTPGSGYGPGPGEDPDHTCTPGAGYGPGPQPTHEEANQPEQAGPHPTEMGSGPQHDPEPNHEPDHGNPEPNDPQDHANDNQGGSGGHH